MSLLHTARRCSIVERLFETLHGAVEMVVTLLAGVAHAARECVASRVEADADSIVIHFPLLLPRLAELALTLASSLVGHFGRVNARSYLAKRLASSSVAGSRRPGPYRMVPSIAIAFLDELAQIPTDTTVAACTVTPVVSRTRERLDLDHDPHLSHKRQLCKFFVSWNTKHRGFRHRWKSESIVSLFLFLLLCLDDLTRRQPLVHSVRQPVIATHLQKHVERRLLLLADCRWLGL